MWTYRGITSATKETREELALHPTVKPVAMLADALKDCCPRGGIVLDGFAGSGSIFIAAHKTGRRARGIEIDPLYCDTIIRRWQSYAKDDAVLVASGRTFADTSEKCNREGDVPAVPIIPSAATETGPLASSRTPTSGEESWPWLLQQPPYRSNEDRVTGQVAGTAEPTLTFPPGISTPTVPKGQES